MTNAVLRGDKYEEVQDGAQQEAEPSGWGASLPAKGRASNS